MPTKFSSLAGGQEYDSTCVHKPLKTFGKLLKRHFENRDQILCRQNGQCTFLFKFVSLGRKKLKNNKKKCKRRLIPKKFNSRLFL